MRHPFRRHRWHVVSVSWNLLGRQTLAKGICTHDRCRATRQVEYPDRMNVEQARLIFPRRSLRAR